MLLLGSVAVMGTGMDCWLMLSRGRLETKDPVMVTLDPCNGGTSHRYHPTLCFSAGPGCRSEMIFLIFPW
jgi:hypothetical protein